MYESLLKELNGRNVVVKPEDVHQYLQMWGFRQADMTKILEKVQNISSDQLDAERKARLITFLKGTKHEASLDDIKAALVSLFLFGVCFSISTVTISDLTQKTPLFFSFYRAICMDLRNCAANQQEKIFQKL